MKSTRAFLLFAAFMSSVYGMKGAEQQLPFIQSADNSFNPSANANAGPSLNDLLTVNSEISIYASYLRESNKITTRLLTPTLKSTMYVD